MIGYTYIQLGTVDSTNNYAMAEIKAGRALHGMVYMAEHQTAGKGQRGKTWQAASGQNITLSIVLKPLTANTHQPFLCSMVVALGCYHFLQNYISDALTIKWPNDMYWENRKVGGILIENIYRGTEWQWTIAGIGININQVVFDSFLHKAVSLKQITGKHFNILSLSKLLCICINNTWEKWAQQGAPYIIDAYNEVLFCREKIVHFKKNTISFDAKVLGVDVMGNLMLQRNGIELFAHGAIEWIMEKPIAHY